MRISDWSSDVCSSDLVGMPAGGSWLRAPVGVDARDGAGHVGLAADHVASIDHHGGNLGDAQPPGIRDTLVGMADAVLQGHAYQRSEEHTSELQSLMRISYAVFCLKKKKQTKRKS